MDLNQFFMAHCDKNWKRAEFSRGHFWSNAKLLSIDSSLIITPTADMNAYRKISWNSLSKPPIPSFAKSNSGLMIFDLPARLIDLPAKNEKKNETLEKKVVAHLKGSHSCNIYNMLNKKTQLKGKKDIFEKMKSVRHDVCASMHFNILNSTCIWRRLTSN